MLWYVQIYLQSDLLILKRQVKEVREGFNEELGERSCETLIEFHVLSRGAVC